MENTNTENLPQPQRGIQERANRGEALLKAVPVKTVPYSLLLPAHYGAFLSAVDSVQSAPADGSYAPSGIIQPAIVRLIREKIESYSTGLPSDPATKAYIAFGKAEQALEQLENATQ